VPLLHHCRLLKAFDISPIVINNFTKLEEKQEYILNCIKKHMNKMVTQLSERFKLRRSNFERQENIIYE